ncbi:MULTISPECIES: STAS domain-containing protein [unclassified Streptomyces]|uniref:STAS domain-containing protein n=1 Tax=Streptomyces sp. NPDC059980 TaxID=3347022 RepID=UPI0036D1F04E
MSERVTVLRMGSVLLVIVPSGLDEATVVTLQEELTTRIAQVAAQGVVLDITAVDVIDTFVSRRLSLVASGAVLLGARPVLVGMRPAVALTLVQLGIELHGIAKARDLEAGLQLLGAWHLFCRAGEEDTQGRLHRVRPPCRIRHRTAGASSGPAHLCART